MSRISIFLGVLATLAPGASPARADSAGKGVTVDKARRAVIIDSKVAPRKINDPRYKEIYPIEVIACWAFPKGQKAHETIVTIEALPSDVHKALEGLGLKPGKPIKGDAKEKVAGPLVNVFIEVPDGGGGWRKVPVERTLVDPRSNKPMPKVKWHFTGSVRTKPDPAKDATVYGADQTGTLIAIFPVTDETVMQTSLTMKEEKYLKLETNKKVLPPEGTAVRLVIEAAK